MELYAILILFLAFPVGYLLASLTREELIPGRKYFYSAIILSSFIALSSLFSSPYDVKSSVFMSMLFVIILCVVSIFKSYDKRFVKHERF